MTRIAIPLAGPECFSHQVAFRRASLQFVYFPQPSHRAVAHKQRPESSATFAIGAEETHWYIGAETRGKNLTPGNPALLIVDFEKMQARHVHRVCETRNRVLVRGGLNES